MVLQKSLEIAEKARCTAEASVTAMKSQLKGGHGVSALLESWSTLRLIGSAAYLAVGTR